MNGTTSAITAYVVITVLLWGYAAWLFLSRTSPRGTAAGPETPLPPSNRSHV